jgi:hypothetical protein
MFACITLHLIPQIENSVCFTTSLPKLTHSSKTRFLGTFLFLLLDIAAAVPILDHAQLMRICQNELSRHNQGTNNSSRFVGAAIAVAPTQLSSNAAVLQSAYQQRGASSNNNVDRLSQQIAANLEQIQRLMNNTNANAAVASPPDRQEIMLSQMTGIGSIRHNTIDHGAFQERQMLRVSQYARLQQRQEDAVAAVTTAARLRREQEQRTASVTAIMAAQSNHQQQCRIDQLQVDLQTLQQMNSLQHDSLYTTPSYFMPTSAAASSALRLAQNPMLGENMASIRNHQQQQDISLQIMMMQHSNMPILVSATNLPYQSALRSQQMYHHHDAPIGRFDNMSHNDDSHRIPLSLPISLARSGDENKLSAHQNFLRQQIEAYQATQEDVTTHTRGRNKPIHLGQVGIRCRHCAHLPVSRRQKGSTYFPSNKLGIYQAAQNMSTAHIQCGLCTEMPEAIKLKFMEIMSAKKPNCSNGAGRPYWAQSATQLGFVDTEEGIRFIRDVPSGIMILE